MLIFKPVIYDAEQHKATLTNDWCLMLTRTRSRVKNMVCFIFILCRYSGRASPKEVDTGKRLTFMLIMVGINFNTSSSLWAKNMSFEKLMKNCLPSQVI